ncbi:MAG: hypothetical protein PHN71_08125, partial [Candidatus Cloacimonetes bacterium]|nr:hypothetical protein [Candidatus Cloacimonadota bacterium]MDD4232512.1 hypothetical protein [Candidatus Cloacimonadota bacterium]MDY0299786.1 hypothetical protein [Candidatus Cloacimonadaceae bacterium]
HFRHFIVFLNHCDNKSLGKSDELSQKSVEPKPARYQHKFTVIVKQIRLETSKASLIYLSA